MFIYQFNHQYWQDDYEPEGFRLGYFSSIERIEECRILLMQKEGFIDHPEGFEIRRHIVKGENYTGVFVLDLVFDDFCDEFIEQYIELGVFESEESANQFADFYQSSKGDDVHSGRFMIEHHVLDKLEWQDGFFTSYEIDKEDRS